jgi:NAD kinase
MLLSIGGDGTILESSYFGSDSGVPILGINAETWFSSNVQKENIDLFSTNCIEGKYTLKNIVEFVYSQQTRLCKILILQ